MKFTLLSIVVAVLFVSCKQKQTPSPSSSTSKLETRVDGLVQSYLDSGKIAGMGVAVYKGNEKLLLKGYGLADIEFDVKLPEDASFEIGSVTKQFTAVSILQLAEQGKLSLDDDFTKYVKFDTKGRKITIRQLLNHTSGIKGYTEMDVFEAIVPHHYKKDTLLRLVEKENFDFEPGEALIYNNSAFFIVGLVIEKVSGMSYEDYVKKNLFDKFGMTNSSYCSSIKVVKKKARGYNLGNDGLEKAAYLDHTWPYAAGSLCSTPEDLVKWNDALHHGKVLSEKMYEELLTTAVLNDGTATRYAKGLTVSDLDGRKLIEHSGGIFGFLSENMYFPAEDLKIVVLINTTGPVSPTQVAIDISEFILGKSAKQDPRYEGDLSRFVGKFKGQGRGTNVEEVVTKSDSGLVIQQGTRKPRTLAYVKDNTFRYGSALYFFTGKGDEISELKVDQIYGYLILKKTK